MRSKLHLPSVLLGALLLVGGLAAVRSAPAQKLKEGTAPSWEYKIVLDPKESEITELARESWEYAGYLGQSPRGENVDETLWKRAK